MSGRISRILNVTRIGRGNAGKSALMDAHISRDVVNVRYQKEHLTSHMAHTASYSGCLIFV